MERRTPPADALTELILEIFRVNGDLLSEGDRLTKQSGQSSARWQVLGAIRNGAQPVAGIARDMGLARQSVQRTADLLELDGLVEYAPNPAHRRAKLVRLSPLGQRVLGQISARQVAWTNRLAASMGADEAEIRQALAVVRKLRAELEGTDAAADQTGGDGEGPPDPTTGGRDRAPDPTGGGRAASAPSERG